MLKTVLSAVCAFTMLACAWMFVMFFVLQHPGFEWRAVVAALVIGQGAATLRVLGVHPRASWPRVGLALGAVATIVVGVQAFAANESSADWEGYVAIVSIALVAQGALTMAVMLRTPAGA